MKNPRAPKLAELNYTDLRWRCNPDIFEFDSTETLKPLEGILGQERALRAIRLGVDLRAPGYNIYIAGLSGTGKATTVKQMLEQISDNCPALRDYVYVNNFNNTDHPILLTFPVGEAKHFKQELASTINLLRKKIPQALESEHYSKRKNQIMEQYTAKEQSLMSAFSERISKDNFSLGQVKIGEMLRPDVLPLVEGKPVSIYQVDDLVNQGKLKKDDALKILNKYNEYQHELHRLVKEGLKISQKFQEKLQVLERETVEVIVIGIVENLKENYGDPKIHEYLQAVCENILNNMQVFKGQKPEGEMTSEGYTIDYFKEYDVNIILDNGETKGCPVIIETSPTYVNLFGTIERMNDGRGGWYADFTNIKAGALLRANGGYLVLNVNHLLEEPGVWRTLKRILTYRKVEIQDLATHFNINPISIKPEPINIETKVILIGSQQLYALLSAYEYDFKKIFKVKADFDYEISHNEKVLIEYAQVIKKLIKTENLCEFDKSAIAYIIELSARLAGQKSKLTTRFSQIADLAREASFWAKDDGFERVTAAHVEKAFNYAKDRHGLYEEKITEMFDDNTFLIDTEGLRVGQVNGLAVYGSDYYSFGRPTRITATVSLGAGSIINVEREAGMSGRHYNKGVLIISGYFRETFGQDLPLSFNANLVFEQSYGTVDGDSASSAEIFALLSTLSGLPIRQDLAVTGSLNQKGDVQPIGGVNEKIEGFFDICKSKGLNNKQGVIIPVQNVKELMLKEEVIEAVKKGVFHIYTIKRVEQGIEILTGVKAGKKLRQGGYEENTVFYYVEKKIKDLYAKSKANITPSSGAPGGRKKTQKKSGKK